MFLRSFATGVIAAALSVASSAQDGLGTARTPFGAERAGFAVRVAGEETSFRVFAFYVLPGETLEITAVADTAAARFEIAEANGKLTPGARSAWTWTAPLRTGLYHLEVRRLDTAEVINLNIFVMVPFSALQKGMLGAYRVGDYPSKPLRGLAAYRPPRGFVEVTADLVDTPVSPHFRLGQFLCKQESGWPKYLALRERLVTKLERLLEEVNGAGIRCDSLQVMSGFRTPYYNRAIGNVTYSRHLWGGAADVFVDENPRDGIMDDLNRDGRIDRGDAKVLFDLVERMTHATWYERLIGGLGLYGSNAQHGPFVHVDVRGYRARW